MIRNIISLVIIILLLTSCGNTGKKEASSKAEGSSEVTKVEFATLVENPNSYIGKNISVEGKVVHVCLESGKKMFIVGENPNIRLFVSASEEMPKFPTELLGNEIVVEGTLTKASDTLETVPGEDLHEGEEEIKAAADDSCETDAALATQPVLSDLMMIYNRHAIK
jgi:RecJ-like exonuclease